MEEKQEQSYILLQFAGIGSAVVAQRTFEGVTPGQVIVASELLNVLGKNAFIVEENQRVQREQEMALHVPENKIVVAGK